MPKLFFGSKPVFPSVLDSVSTGVSSMDFLLVFTHSFQLQLCVFV